MPPVIEIQGIDKVVKRLNKVFNGISPEQLEKVLRQGAVVIKRNVERRIGGKFAVKTGLLKSSPRAKKSRVRGRTFAAVFAAIDRSKRSGAPHAHLLEFGTSRMPAKPFFRPGIDESKAEVEAVVNAGIKQLLGDGLT